MNMVVFPLRLGGEFAPQVEEYFGVLLQREDRWSVRLTRGIGETSLLMQPLYGSVVVLGWKAKFMISNIYIPTLTYGHEFWVANKKKLLIQEAKEFLS